MLKNCTQSQSECMWGSKLLYNDYWVTRSCRLDYWKRSFIPIPHLHSCYLQTFRWKPLKKVKATPVQTAPVKYPISGQNACSHNIVIGNPSTGRLYPAHFLSIGLNSDHQSAGHTLVKYAREVERAEGPRLIDQILVSGRASQGLAQGDRRRYVPAVTMYRAMHWFSETKI